MDLLELGSSTVPAVTELIDITLMNKRVANVFKIPPMSSSKGHKAEEWRGNQVWTGLCRVMMDNLNRCKVQLINEADGTLFAQSMIPDNESYEQYVQRCYDSSRFFALQLVSDSG